MENLQRKLGSRLISQTKQMRSEESVKSESKLFNSPVPPSAPALIVLTPSQAPAPAPAPATA